jgi:hypothetical protein
VIEYGVPWRIFEAETSSYGHEKRTGFQTLPSTEYACEFHLVLQLSSSLSACQNVRNTLQPTPGQYHELHAVFARYMCCSTKSEFFVGLLLPYATRPTHNRAFMHVSKRAKIGSRHRDGKQVVQKGAVYAETQPRKRTLTGGSVEVSTLATTAL